MRTAAALMQPLDRGFGKQLGQTGGANAASLG